MVVCKATNKPPTATSLFFFEQAWMHILDVVIVGIHSAVELIVSGVRESQTGLVWMLCLQFTRHLFTLEQQEYESEGIDWTKVDFVDNQECVDVIEMAPPKVGACWGAVGKLATAGHVGNWDRSWLITHTWAHGRRKHPGCLHLTAAVAFSFRA